MKWFFAFNQMSEQSYGDFVRVAVVTARKNTELEAFCLYDGQATELTDWMERQGVTILPCRFRFAKWWEDLAIRQGSNLVARIALGAFLRFELPDVMARENLTDDFALYTDCDVMFECDIRSFLEPLKPEFFAVAPETFQNNRLHMNSGVMWMNVNRLRETNALFMRFAQGHMTQASLASFDQGIYRAYFNSLHRIAWQLGIPDRYFYALMSRLPLKTWQWDDLPLELNWKPYWGENPEAAIVHFHALKPTQRAELESGELPAHFAAMRTPYWEKCVVKWDAWLEEAKKL
jgi:hypothetical protein